MTTIQERLRNPRSIEVLTSAAEDAADHIDALEAKLETATEAAATYRKAMMELTAMLVESAAKVDALTKDAERYRITRGKSNLRVCKWHIAGNDEDYSWWVAQESEIDAAIKLQKETK